MILLKNLKIIIKDKKVKLDNIFNLLIYFREYYKQQKINLKKLITDFKKYYNQISFDMFTIENDYDDLLIQFDDLDYKDQR